ncbi:MAG: hypothetical protein HQ556_03165 [Candidatus Marinimicrobia bacterium]|nr:hypothetical protein [Candidatus Neomarinimicrobiota bacterium]
MGILEKNIENLEWPSPDQDLFNGGDPHKWINARLDILGQEEKTYLYASGYKEAAELVFMNLDSMARHHDILVYPIVFLMRQSLELLLKDIIGTCYQILEVKEGIPNVHPLLDLWSEVKSKLKEVGVAIEKKDRSSFQKLVTQFDHFDRGSYAFRYPHDKKGKESLPDVQKINLENFMKVSAGMYNLLYGIDVEVAEYLSNIRGSV